jgi:hypothetical protein
MMRDSYREVSGGNMPGAHETERRVWWEGPKLIAQFTADGQAGLERLPVAGTEIAIEAWKADARIAMRLDLGFAPDGDVRLTDNSLVNGEPAIPPVFLYDVLGRAQIWLAGCVDIGGALREAEDLVGTQAAYVRIVAQGLWGAIYEVDTDCRSVRGSIRLTVPGIPGRWLVRAKWTAIEPMSEQDWRKARERMQLIVSSPWTGPLADNVEAT